MSNYQAWKDFIQRDMERWYHRATACECPEDVALDVASEAVPIGAYSIAAFWSEYREIFDGAYERLMGEKPVNGETDLALWTLDIFAVANVIAREHLFGLQREAEVA